MNIAKRLFNSDNGTEPWVLCDEEAKGAVVAK